MVKKKKEIKKFNKIAPAVQPKEDNRESFRKFFIKIKGKLKLTSDLEEVIWMHFVRSGFDKKEKFEDGLKHFGYKI